MKRQTRRQTNRLTDHFSQPVAPFLMFTVSPSVVLSFGTHSWLFEGVTFSCVSGGTWLWKYEPETTRNLVLWFRDGYTSGLEHLTGDQEFQSEYGKWNKGTFWQIIDIMIKTPWQHSSMLHAPSPRHEASTKFEEPWREPWLVYWPKHLTKHNSEIKSSISQPAQCGRGALIGMFSQPFSLPS